MSEPRVECQISYTHCLSEISRCTVGITTPYRKSALAPSRDGDSQGRTHFYRRCKRKRAECCCCLDGCAVVPLPVPLTDHQLLIIGPHDQRANARLTALQQEQYDDAGNDGRCRWSHRRRSPVQGQRDSCRRANRSLTAVDEGRAARHWEGQQKANGVVDGPHPIRRQPGIVTTLYCVTPVMTACV